MPVRVETASNPLTGIIAVDAIKERSLALKSVGGVNTVWAWGDGSLGDGSFQSFNRPKQVAGLTNIVQLADGGDHALVLQSTGEVWAWGLNHKGQLGDGTGSASTVVKMIGFDLK